LFNERVDIAVDGATTAPGKTVEPWREGGRGVHTATNARGSSGCYRWSGIDAVAQQVRPGTRSLAKSSGR
jgi:hypothetical protein